MSSNCDIEPCSLCGGAAHHESLGVRKFWIECGICDNESPGVDDSRTAEEVWNYAQVLRSQGTVK